MKGRGCNFPISVSTVDFELAGQNFTVLNGGPMYKLTEAASILVTCKELSCGWVTDKYGVTWQIVPESLDAMMNDPDAAKAERVNTAMLGIEGKLDVAELEKAYRGE